MKDGLNGFTIIICFALVILPDVCFGITAGSLQKILKEGETITIVDVRGRGDFTSGHIPNAISIPAPVVKYKQLPPMGKVIVCGDGINTADTIEAARALNLKTGIDAEILEGGFPAWLALRYPSTHKIGITRQMFRYITYQKLKKASGNNRGMVLVDMRRVGVLKKSIRSSEDDYLSNLNENFPGLEVITLASRDLKSRGKVEAESMAKFFHARENGQGKVFVLIGSGDGQAEKVTRHLHGAGITQVIILAGGERVLRKNGQSGLETQVVKE